MHSSSFLLPFFTWADANSQRALSPLGHLAGIVLSCIANQGEETTCEQKSAT